MSFFSIDVQCTSCGDKFDVLVPRDAADVPVLCLCGGEATRTVSKPNNLRASYPDGRKRFGKLRAQAAADLAISEANWKGDTKEANKIAIEKGKMK